MKQGTVQARIAADARKTMRKFWRKENAKMGRLGRYAGELIGRDVMRSLASLYAAVCVSACEANAPNAWQPLDTQETTDPYNDPDCPQLSLRQQQAIACAKNGKVALYGSCVTAKQAQMACADLSDKSLCHDAESGLCVSCVPL